jgi:transposase
MRKEGLNMLTVTHATVARPEVCAAFRPTADMRLRERYQTILLRVDGQSCPEIAQWLYRDEGTIRACVHTFNKAGLGGLERATILGRPA